LAPTPSAQPAGDHVCASSEFLVGQIPSFERDGPCGLVCAGLRVDQPMQPFHSDDPMISFMISLLPA